MMLIFIDGFPVDEPIQRDIDEDLRHGDGLRHTYSTNSQRFPKFFQLTALARAEWTAPLLERIEWHLHNSTGDTPWLQDLSTLLEVALRDTPSLPDPSLAQLARLVPALGSSGPSQALDKLAALLRKRKAPLGPEILRDAQFALREIKPATGAGVSKLAWIVFLAQDTPDDDWSAAAQRSLRSMPPAERKNWDGLWALIDFHANEELVPQNSAARRKAVEQIGLPVFEARFQEWLAPLEDSPPHQMSRAGEVLLRQLLRAASAVPELQVDQPLYALSGVQWADAMQTIFWLNALVNTVATRPPTQAFACAERLAQNPTTSSFLEVQRLYASQMANALRDGDSKPPLQQIIDQMLCDSRMPQPGEMAAGERWIGGTRKMAVATALQSAGPDLKLLFRALLERMQGSAERAKPLIIDLHNSDGLMEISALNDAVSEILRRQPELLTARGPEAIQDFTALCKIDVIPQHGAFSSFLLTAAQQRVASYGYETELVPVLTAWQKGLHGSNSALDIRHNIEWLLWFDDSTPVNEKDCWSSTIRKDLRAMKPELRQRWIALLQNISFALVEKPPAKWKKPAEKLLRDLGTPAFREGVLRWFEPFRDRTPLKLTVRGRDVLRNFMWYALLAKDPQVDQALAWFATAQWKTKDAKNYTAKLLPAWAYVLGQRSIPLAVDALETYTREGGFQLEGKTYRMYTEYCSEAGRSTGISAPAPPPAPSSMAELTIQAAQKSLAALGMTATVESGAVRVKGKLDEYLVSINDGAITRVSDGRPIRLELDMNQGPYRHFKAALDGPDIQGQPNMFRVMLCARILQNDAAERDKIVAE